MAQDNGPAPEDWPAAAGTGDTGAALQASEQQFQGAFGSVPCGMVVTSLSPTQWGCCLAVNDAFCQLMGYAREELAGTDLLGYVHPEDQAAFDTLIQQIVAGETSQIRADLRLTSQDGEIVYARLTGSAIQPPAGTRYLAAFVEDVTAAEQARARQGEARGGAGRLPPPGKPGSDGRRNRARLQQPAHGDRQLREPGPRRDQRGRGDREHDQVGTGPLGRGADRGRRGPGEAPDQARAGVRPARRGPAGAGGSRPADQRHHDAPGRDAGRGHPRRRRAGPGPVGGGGRPRAARAGDRQHRGERARRHARRRPDHDHRRQHRHRGHQGRRSRGRAAGRGPAGRAASRPLRRAVHHRHRARHGPGDRGPGL